MEALNGLLVPIILPACLTAFGVSIRRQSAGPRWLGTLLVVVSVVGLLLVAAVEAVLLTTFDRS